MKSSTILKTLPIALAALSLSGDVLGQSTYGSASSQLSPAAVPTGSSALAGGSDNCASSESISGLGVFAYDTTLASTGTQGQSEGLCSGFGGSGIAFDVWYSWTATFTGTARMSTCGLTTDDTKIAVYAGGVCPTAGSAIACNDDACVAQSTATFPVTNGSVYTLQLGHWPGSLPGTGSFSMSQVQEPTCGQPHDGTAEDAVGLTFGGDIACLVYNDCMQTINSMEVAFGSPLGTTIPNGSPVSIAIWDDLNNDHDPSDAVLIGLYAIPGGVVNSGTGILNSYSMATILGAPYVATGGTFVGVVLTHGPGQFAGPVDSDASSGDQDWLVSNSTAGSFNFTDLTLNDVQPIPLNDVLPGRFLLTLSGTGSPTGNTGTPYCFGDGSGNACPCGNTGAAGGGCANSNGIGSGATLVATGNGFFGANDTLALSITGVPGAKPGLILRGNIQVGGGNGAPVGDGLICAAGGSMRSHIQVTSAAGATTFTNFNGAPFGNVANVGTPTNFQFWYRDPMGGPCANGFNFTNAWTVTYVP